MECEKCNGVHDGSFGTGRFCSRKCANSRTWSEDDKLNKSISAKRSDKVNQENSSRRKTRIMKTCPVCKETFGTINDDKIYCSRQCYTDDVGGQFRTLAPGGIRKGAGRGKSGYYKQFWCDSTYELAYVIFCEINNIHIERNTESWEYYDNVRNGIFRYYPDFIVDGDLIEIKGRKTYVDELKINSVKDRNIILLYESNLKEVFETVVHHTNVPIKDLWILYDNSKPTYTHICLNCNTSFESNRSNAVHCSRKCSGEYAANRLHG